MFTKKSISFILSGLLMLMSMPLLANDDIPVSNQTLKVQDQNGNILTTAPVKIKQYTITNKQDSLILFNNTSSVNSEKIIEVEGEIKTSALTSTLSSLSDHLYDSSGSVKVWGRITYDKDFEGKYRLTKVEGNTRVLDTRAVYIPSERVRVACRPQIGEGSNQNFSFSPTPGPFSRNTGFTKYVDIHEPFARCGMSIEVNIKRRSNNSQWKLVLPVALTDGFQNVSI